MKKSSLSLIVVSVFLFSTGLILAANDCTFTTSEKTMSLNGDCTTDETIFIPDGFTLNGENHTITAVDPSSGHFVGAVVKNSGLKAHVKNLKITTDSLDNVCDGGADRLRGIMFEAASGSIKNNEVMNINQGASGCQEGNAIEVRNAPFDGTHPNTQNVTIKENIIKNYQKTGIVANGDVKATVTENEIHGLGQVNYIAQNGIQLGFGAMGKVKKNIVDGNWYTGENFVSTGILDFEVNGIKSEENTLIDNQVGLYIQGNYNKAKENIFDPNFWGLILFGDNNTASENDVFCQFVGINIFGNYNLVKENHIHGNETIMCETGILDEKDEGTGIGNIIKENEFDFVVNEIVDPEPATPLVLPFE